MPKTQIVQLEVSGKAPEGRSAFGVALYKRDMYIFGGWCGIYGASFCDLHRFNLDDHTWYEVVPSTSVRPPTIRSVNIVVYHDR